MIIVKLVGGLGNQMFEYAAGRRLAAHHNTELKLDLSWFENDAKNADAVRVYELDCFKLDADIATHEELAPFNAEAKPGLLDKILGRPGNEITNEKAYQFDPAILKLPDNSYLEGYWQSEKYFKDVADIIRRDFEYNTGANSRNAEMLKTIAGVNSVSLHVRRGDYVTSATTNQFHGLAPLDYYKAAIAEISKKVKDPHFFIFSDDPQWCKDNLKFDYPTTYVDHNPVDKGFEDMRLMRNCQHNIIANSSFSWWGAWLNPNPDKIVYAPKRWFNDASIDTGDVAADGWILL